jgi:cytosine permease
MNADEFSTSKVPSDRSIPWWKIAVSNVLFSVSLPSLITGLDLAHAAPKGTFLPGVMVGSLILTFIGILTSVVGSRARPVSVPTCWHASPSEPRDRRFST